MQPVPVAGGMLYVQPIYAMSPGADVSEYAVAGVAVVNGDKIAVRQTLSEALSELFGVKRQEEQIRDMTLDAAIGAVIERYADVKKFSADADWESYGRALKELDDAIQDMELLRGSSEEAE
jgi:uncharacterized membrane protein (UPF0182 family)